MHKEGLKVIQCFGDDSLGYILKINDNYYYYM